MIDFPKSRILRSALRRSNLFKDSSSYPYLSGDTFKRHCDVDLNDNFSKLVQGDRDATTFFLNVSEVDAFARWLTRLDIPFLDQKSLYIHNGDVIPDHEVYAFLASQFSKVYSVNWLGNLHNVHAIPIGLENQRYLQNGVPSDFYNQEKKPWNNRKIDLLVAFSFATNIQERRLAYYAAKDLKGMFIQESFVSPHEYRNLVSNSKFVLSPPGNGPDCHRTWEAIYLGAIPIVHSQYWNFPGLESNVGVVENWNDLEVAMNSNLVPLKSPIEYLQDKYLGA